MPSRRRSRYWHDPERLQGQAQRDAQLGRSEFYVYVLDTDFGDYVGHTWHVGRRLKQHQAGEVKSTAGSYPTLLWVSRPFTTREDAARFEASLKSLRDQQATRYAEIVGHDAKPLRAPIPPQESGLPLVVAAAISAAAMVVVVLLVVLFANV